MIGEEDKLPFTAHLDELRSRLIKSFIAVGAGFVLCYGFKEQLFDVLLYPLIQVMPEGGKLIFTGIPEAFFTYLKVSFLAGILLPARCSSTSSGCSWPPGSTAKNDTCSARSSR